MLALLLTSVGLMGLVQTQRTLLHAQRAQEQRLEAWRYARGALAQATLPLQTPSEEGYRRGGAGRWGCATPDPVVCWCAISPRRGGALSAWQS
ncbi:hypothetical protein DCE53_03405 [Edwardsiella piscicida]|uniref:type IV pilus modification PilV family protein n=1 Tax=Edwardsiella piscicida TaxID=1263550 RepID=UPI001CF4DBB5|nr:hypothetical protein [Edwardsiella piscicida]UCQ15341.1 hypothetical protein DCE53_03405 [Edwardsiella piscicida]WLJ44133.1 hypothetical protein Q8004_03560 [Edwardsiella piscicida]